jgi:hypothetical protein
VTNDKLTIDDIADLRAYERERDDFRRRVIALKKRRRIGVGPIVTFLFENRDTIRFQVQEMARAEKIITDEGIQTELDVYNPLIPEPGNLAATMFIELTNTDDLERWLPALVGIERAVRLRIGPDEVVAASVDADHDKQLTREAVTASVHYVHFALTPEQVARFAAADEVRLEIDLPAYGEGAYLDEAARTELLTDLKG